MEEWKLDVPTIGAIYYDTPVVWYLSGLGRPLSLKEGDLESDRCWFRRAWTVQEVGRERIIAGDTPDGPLHAEPIDDAGNYENELLTKFHKQLKSAKIPPNNVYGVLSAMQGRISTYPIDKVAGLAFSLDSSAIPAYYESQSLEDVWTEVINEMLWDNRSFLFLTYPEPGTGCKKWRPSWQQVMTNLPRDRRTDWLAGSVKRGDDGDWWGDFHCIERGFVRGLAVGGGEGIDRCGELVVENAYGIAHSFNIVASHQCPIPEDTYTLLGCNPFSYLEGYEIRSLQYWVAGRRLPNKMFEKVCVFKINDSNEIQRLKALGLSEMSYSSLA